MPLVVAVSRDPRTRSALERYLEGRGYETDTFPNYDALMLDLDPSAPDGLVVDVQGVPRGQTGARFTQFNQWLARTYATRPPHFVYLLRKGSRRPRIDLPGPIIKKPFPLEALGETLRGQLGWPLAPRRTLRIEAETNTLHGSAGTAHLTAIEANLLAYLMEHQGEILHPGKLLSDVWQYRDSTGAGTLVRAHVSNLRRKMRAVLGDEQLPLETIRGKGYRFVA